MLSKEGDELLVCGSDNRVEKALGGRKRAVWSSGASSTHNNLFLSSLTRMSEP